MVLHGEKERPKDEPKRGKSRIPHTSSKALRSSKVDGKEARIGRIRKSFGLISLKKKECSKKSDTYSDADPLVRDISATVNNLIAFGSIDDAIDAIVAAINGNLHKPLVLKFCFSAFLDLASNRSNLRTVASRGVPEAIARGMVAYQSDTDIQNQGATVIWKLTRDALCTRAVVSSGCCALMVDTLLWHKDSESVVVTLFAVITSLTLDIGGMEALEKSQAWSAVTLAMAANKQMATIQMNGCVLLNYLCSTGNRVQIIPQEGFDTILNAMVTHPQDPKVQKAACAALEKFTSSERNCRSLASSELPSVALLCHAVEMFLEDCENYAEYTLQRLVRKAQGAEAVREKEEFHELVQGEQAEKVEMRVDETINPEEMMITATAAGRSGDYVLALSLFQEILKLKKSLYGPFAATADLVNVLDCIGYVKCIQSDYVGAIESYKESLAMQGTINGAGAVGPTNEGQVTDMLNIISTIGMLYMKCHDYDNAEIYLMKSLEEREKIYSPLLKNVDMAKSLENLGDLHKFRGNYSVAEGFYKRSSACLGSPEAKDHFKELSNIMRKIGLTAGARGDNIVAQKSFNFSLELKKKFYGPRDKNVDLVEALNHLGYTFAVTGQLAEAIEKYEESIEMQKNMNGDVSSDILVQTLTSLGIIHAQCGNYIVARDFLEDALDSIFSIKDRVKEVSVSFLSIYLNLGQVCSEDKQWEDAETYYKKALLEMQHKNNCNKDAADALTKLGNIATERRDLANAKLYFKEALDKKKLIYGPNANNDDMSDILHCLGTLHLDCNNYALAKKFLTEALGMKRQIYGKSTRNPDIVETLLNLAKVYMNYRDFEYATSLYKEALNVIDSNKDLDGMTLKSANIRTELGIVASMRGDIISAQEHFKAALETKIDMYEPETSNIDLVKALNQLGYSFAVAGDFRNAILQYEESLKMQKQINGNDNLPEEVENIQKTLHVLYEKIAELPIEKYQQQ